MKKILPILAVLIAASAVDAAPDVAPGCFGRTYDRAHLARHPDQLVTAMRLHLTPDSFGLWVWLRGRDDELSAGGKCLQKPSGFFCRVGTHDRADNNGVRIASRGRDTVMVYVDDPILMYYGIDDTELLSPGKDDDVFRLDRVDARMCRG
jgi:hypothetical protein